MVSTGVQAWQGYVTHALSVHQTHRNIDSWCVSSSADVLLPKWLTTTKDSIHKVPFVTVLFKQNESCFNLKTHYEGNNVMQYL